MTPTPQQLRHLRERHSEIKEIFTPEKRRRTLDDGSCFFYCAGHAGDKFLDRCGKDCTFAMHAARWWRDASTDPVVLSWLLAQDTVVVYLDDRAWKSSCEIMYSIVIIDDHMRRHEDMLPDARVAQRALYLATLLELPTDELNAAIVECLTNVPQKFKPAVLGLVAELKSRRAQ